MNVATESRASPGLTERAASPYAAASPVSVLLVDDHPAQLLAHEAVLAKLDVQCVKARSGAEALERFAQQEFAVILLDIKMPGMDGFEVAQRMRAHPTQGDTPIVFATCAHPAELDRLKGYKVGAVDYVSLPTAPEALRAKVAMLVELHQRRKEVNQLNRALEDARARLGAGRGHDGATPLSFLDHPTEHIVVVEAERTSAGQVSDWIYRDANANALKLLGLSRESLLGRRLRDVAPDHAERASALCAQVLASGEMLRYETRVAERDLLVTLFAMNDDSIVGSALDVTERKIAMTALRESERRYRALIEDAPVAVAHNRLDGRFEYANKAFCDLVGYTAHELCRTTWQAITHPDDLKHDLGIVTRVLARELPHYTLEKRYVRKDGTFVWVSLFGNFVFDDAGKPVQGVAAVVDITERRRTESALRVSEERFRELANHIDQLVWTCDELGEATWYNERWYDFTGTTFDTMRGDGWKQVHHPAHLERVVDHLHVCIEAGTPWEDTFPLRAKDGTYRWFLSRAVPIRDETGRVVRWFGTNTDVSELRGLEEALIDADRRKDDFLAMLSHELRNPVAPIRNAAEALARLSLKDERSRSLVGLIRRQTEQLARLLDDLLDVARITQGRIELRREVIPLAACVELALETAEPLIHERRHRLIVTEEEQPLHVNADKVRLVQCLVNLLSNAAKYTEPGGEIRLRAFAEAGTAVVEVEDTGQGISAELLPRIFDRFVQSERPPDRAQGGLGLGLSACKQLVEMHGGAVVATSAGTGRGATFSIRLPITGKPVEEPASTAPVSEARRRVLIVDDSRDGADSLATLLQLLGHEVRAAYAPEAALAQVGSFDPDLVLLDIGLPRIDGYEVARRMRADAPARRLVALSGYGRNEDRQRSAEAGFDAHLVKPVDLVELRRVIASAC